MRNYIVALIPLIIIIAGIALYFFGYKYAINRRLQTGETSGHFISPAELALVVLTVFLLISNSSNRAEIRNLNMQVNNLNSSISMLSSQIAEMQKDDSHKFEYSMQAKSIYRDGNEYYAIIEMTVYPLLTTETTSAVLHVDGQEFELVKKDNQLVIDFSISTTRLPQSCFLIVKFADGSVREDIYFEPEKLFIEMFPTVNYSGSVEFSSRTLKADVSVSVVTTENYDEESLTETRLLITDNDQIVYEEKLDQKMMTGVIHFKGKISEESNVRIYAISTASNGWKFYSYFYGDNENDHFLTNHFTAVDQDGIIVVSY